MLIHINGKDIDVPFDAKMITLDKYVQFNQNFGTELDKEFKDIVEKKVGIEEKSALIDDHLDKEAIYWFSFWTGIKVSEAKKLPDMVKFINSYKTLRFMFKIAEDDASVFPYEFEWEGDTWSIQDFKVNAASEMSFNEIVTSKEVMRQTLDLSQGKWTAMPYLCAIFLRKKDEKFADSLIYENSERLNLFKRLPLQYALYVGFFINCSVSILRIRSAYSEKAEHQTANQN